MFSACLQREAAVSSRRREIELVASERAAVAEAISEPSALGMPSLPFAAESSLEPCGKFSSVQFSYKWMPSCAARVQL